jgi:pimeloyl-ACP methyl ester carboxylesterase
MTSHSLETRRGIVSELREWGGGAPVLYLHGAGGLFQSEPLLERLAERYHVYAPVWPGYGPEAGEDLLEDMLDFALHGWDVAEALGLDRVSLVGHSMGGMIAAEMAALCPRQVEKLVLIDAAGLWIDAHPVADIFGMTPFEMPGYLFHDPAKGEAFLGGGRNFADNTALTEFMVGNARRLGTAGKILFPVPNRRVAKRLYRVTAPALVLWGAQDRLIPPVYADRWAELLPQARRVLIEDAGHMLPYEQPEAAAAAISGFFGA